MGIPKNEIERRQAFIGRRVWFAGVTWVIIGVNYLGDFDIERREQRPWDDPAYDEDGRCCHGVICRTSCRFGLPESHHHHARLVFDGLAGDSNCEASRRQLADNMG
jgi:hypothetical protein